ncbi:MAG: hypothetical protein JXB34_08735 [Bacteroidales bacterium]|nr:hypothetical protein [Bacteroidales bacterium]
MLRTILLLIALFAIGAPRSQAQKYAAYTDYMGRFYIFDNGRSQVVDDLPPQSHKIGGTCILYVNSPGHLCIYQNGKSEVLEKSGVTEYYTGDFLAAYSIYEKLKVIFNGKVIELSNRCPHYYASDSIVSFYDKNSESLKIFYNGKTSEIQSGILGNPVKIWSAGDNIFSYISDINNDFYIWYKGNNYLITRNVGNVRFRAGSDVVAFNDEIDQNFKVFYKGEVFVVDDFMAKSFKAGDGFVAFVTQSDEFKVFENGSTQLISTNPPDEYIAEDKILVFAENNRFKIWFNQNEQEIEAYIPPLFKTDWNTIAYLDNSNRIWIYQDGERKYFANEFVNSFDIYRDLIFMNVKINRNIIYFNGNFYEGGSF